MIIRQGDDGDVLYVVEEGTLECYKNIDGNEKMVKVVGPGDAFGELALLYSCPRAASVKAAEKCLLWELGRDTFNHIVKDASAKKREKHEAFLKQVPLLEGMEPYERSKVSDALQHETYEAGVTIVNQGDPGDKFFIIEDGEAIATKSFVQGQIPQEVMQYKVGDYFGELARRTWLQRRRFACSSWTGARSSVFSVLWRTSCGGIPRVTRRLFCSARRDSSRRTRFRFARSCKHGAGPDPVCHRCAAAFAVFGSALSPSNGRSEGFVLALRRSTEACEGSVQANVRAFLCRACARAVLCLARALAPCPVAPARQACSGALGAQVTAQE